MRELLLAGTATIGLIGAAAAQTTAVQTQPPPPIGIMGVPVAPSTYLGGNNSLNSDGGPLPSSPAAPTPGTMTIHMNGRVWGYVGVQGGSGSVVAGNKLAPEQFIGYFRLYPGVDALATNGLRYGAIVEIRQNFIGQSYGLQIGNANVGSTTALASNNTAGNYASSPSGDSSASTLYVRREAVYFGSDQVGIVRLGQDDGPFSQFDNGGTTFQFGTGAWNGDGPDLIPGNASANANFPFWSGIGAEYDPAKIAYFSPRFAGFDLGLSFAPNNGANNASPCPVAAAGCVAIASASTTAFGGENRPTNWYEVMGRYQGNFGGLGVYGILGYSGSGHVKAPLGPPGGAFNGSYNGFATGDAGLAMTFAGFTVGGNVLWGAFNNQVQLKPEGAPNAVAWVGGALYAVGPITLAASYYNYQFQGSTATLINGKSLSQRYDDAFAAGITYSIAPGLTGYAEYLYSQSHQGGVNLLGVGTSAEHNDVHVQSFILGTRVQW